MGGASIGRPLTRNSKQTPLVNLISNYKSRANRCNIEFAISKRLFAKLTKQRCYYCGTKPSQIYVYNRKHLRHVYKPIIYNSIDRINSSLGYVDGNVVPCCKLCNYMKKDYTIEIFIKHCKKVAAWIN